MGDLRKAEWALHYDDGSEKIVVKIDLTSERLPHSIALEMSGDRWLYVDAADVPWLCARLLDAASIIEKARPAKDAPHA